MAEKKSYLMSMQLEMLTDDDETVKAPHYADPISPETKEMIEKVSKGLGRRSNL